MARSISQAPMSDREKTNGHYLKTPEGAYEQMAFKQFLLFKKSAFDSIRRKSHKNKGYFQPYTEVKRPGFQDRNDYPLYSLQYALIYLLILIMINELTSLMINECLFICQYPLSEINI